MAGPDLEGVIRFVERAYGRLDRLSYYQLLNLPAQAPVAEIRATYYKLAGRLHPDLYGRHLSSDVKAHLTSVYSRIVEAYKVLTDDGRRKLYDQELAAGRVRLTADAEAQPKRDRPEDQIRNAAARKFFLLAQTALAAGDRKTAAVNLKLALSVEPGSAVIRAALADAESE